MRDSPIESGVLSSRSLLTTVDPVVGDLIVPIAMRKRALDIFAGLLLAVLSVPLLVGLAMGSFVVYRTWPFFSHHRVGTYGRIFRLVKIRSLPPSTPNYASKVELRRYGNNGWGVFIRKHHLDELPQFWHVVSGRMSLVGPRPEMPQLVAEMPREFAAQRLSVLPGCTGLWQITAASAGLIRDAQEFDLYYVNNWTLRLDLWILYKTVGDLLRHSQLDSLNSIPRWTRPKEVRSQIVVERIST
jgi:lipopolysaccharide/colanic/teichoic acid biosynthesis glycosyltransferase